MKIIAVANQKGGVAKTSTALCLAYGLAHRKFKVLGVDLDPQANFTVSCGAKKDNVPTMFNLLSDTEDCKAADVIQRCGIIDVIPSNDFLSSTVVQLSVTGGQFRLKEKMADVVDRYDYIIIDTPPTLNMLTLNAFTAATDVLVPTNAGSYAIEGIKQLNNTINTIRKYTNRDLRIMGVLYTNYIKHSNVGRQFYDFGFKMADLLSTKVFKTYIRPNCAVQEAQALAVDLFEYKPHCNAAIDYNNLINEILEDEQ